MLSASRSTLSVVKAPRRRGIDHRQKLRVGEALVALEQDGRNDRVLRLGRGRLRPERPAYPREGRSDNDRQRQNGSAQQLRRINHIYTF